MSPDDLPRAVGRLELTIDRAVFSDLAVKKACYRLAELVSADVQKVSAQELRVSLLLLDATNDAAAVEAAFRRELLDQDLRERIARETEPLRNLIMAHALSRVPLLHADEEAADYE